MFWPFPSFPVAAVVELLTDVVFRTCSSQHPPFKGPPDGSRRRYDGARRGRQARGICERRSERKEPDGPQGPGPPRPYCPKSPRAACGPSEASARGSGRGCRRLRAAPTPTDRPPEASKGLAVIGCRTGPALVSEKTSSGLVTR